MILFLRRYILKDSQKFKKQITEHFENLESLLIFYSCVKINNIDQLFATKDKDVRNRVLTPDLYTITLILERCIEDRALPQ